MGASIVMLCRDRSRGEWARADIVKQSGNQNVRVMFCDLASQKSIRSFALDFAQEYKKLDVLINNAGVFMMRRSITEDGFESTFAINHLAYFLLTNLLLPLLKNAAPSRIVNVSSTVHSYGHINFADLQMESNYSAFGAYAGSKLANILFTRALARRLDGTGVTANCLHPGAVSTSLFRSLPKPLESIIKLITISPARGARTTVYLATSPEVANVSGKYFVRCRETAPSSEAQNDELADRLWMVSEQLTGLSTIRDAAHTQRA
jgi:NAD(P)-dependent dehydrogenase (short-subunit alcohol dehydrogenase family)